MQRFDPIRLYEIDLSDSQLSQEEIAEFVARLDKAADLEARRLRERKARRTNFRFSGGML